MDNTELLFFDTFSHDISEELNLDLVQFPKPVYISEIRIIPLGARVQADFPGGVRLGATNPSQFEIEFFVNDLSKPGASTFESLGGLEYKQNVHIQLECDRKHLPTDGLVLRGWYTTITLAVYGSLTKSLSTPPEIPAAAPTTPVPVPQEEAAPVNNNQTPDQEQEWHYENKGHTQKKAQCAVPTPSPPVHAAPVAAELHQPSRTPSAEPPKSESQQWKEASSQQQQQQQQPHKSVKRPSTPPTESLVSLSPESISAEEEEEEELEEEVEREETEEQSAVEPFEPILSDEDVMADDEPPTVDMEYDVTIDADELYGIKPPDLLDLKEQQECSFEERLDQMVVQKLQDVIALLSKSVSSNFAGASGQEKEMFVHNCENLCTTLKNFETERRDLENLSIIVEAGLNVELACTQPQPAYKVRHVKVGVRLAEALCRLSSGPEALLAVGAPQMLLSLCMRENVALPVKLAAIRAVDAALISPGIAEQFLRADSELYRLCLLMLDSTRLARLKYALSSLLRKLHVYECLSRPAQHLDELELLELARAYSCAPTLMAQPRRRLPASAQMEIEREQGREPRKHLIAYFEHWELLERLLRALPEHPEACRQLLALLSDSSEGLLFMLRRPAQTVALLKELGYEQPGLGSELAWRLQVVQCLLGLAGRPRDWAPLRRLHSFLVFPEGLRAVVQVLPLGGFLDVLLDCLASGDVADFAAELIAACLRYSARLEVFQSRAAELLDKYSGNPVLRDVLPHLSVAAQSANWNHGDVTSLVAVLRKNAEVASTLPGELTTACRILHYLVFSPHDDVDPMEPYVELKHRNALTQLFAADGLSALVAIMANLARFYEQTLVHRGSLTGRRCLSLIALLTPCVRLTRAILERLVKCMATDFKDLTSVVPLLGVYCLVEAMPATTHAKAALSGEVVETLLVFTRAVDSDGSGNVAKSLWTQMLGEVLKTVSSHPCNFAPGLRLLTRLLPPILTCREEANKARAVGFRKLWSAHLQAQASSLTETLRLLCASWNAELLSLLSSLCKQLSDLAAPTALLVGRCLLDGILDADLPLQSNLPMLTLLGDLARHAPMKATLLTLTNPASRAQVKSDQKYPPVIDLMCTALRSSNDANAQRELVDILQTLCDHRLSLVDEEAALAHSVPSKEPLLVIIAALIDILASASKYPVDIVETALNILCCLTAHNYGLYHVKSCLENNPDALRNLLDYIAEAVSEKKEEQEKNEPLPKLVVGFLDGLISCKTPNRTLSLRVPQLSALLCWGGDKDNHPLLKISQAAQLVESLHVCVEEQQQEPIPEMLEPLLLSPEALLNQFTRRSVHAISSRASSIVSDEEKLRKNSLLEIQNDNSVDLLALATELLPADFNLLAEAQRICSKVPSLDLQQQQQQLHTKDQDENQDRKSQKQTIILTAKTNNSRQPFVAPMRGRSQYSNSLRGNSVSGIGRGADPFRSRPPNTSRPPSLHVDDFVALETCGAQPTGPTGYNKLSIRGSNQSRGVITSSRSSRPWATETRSLYQR